jgi:osmoprotectant transport system substrate-binding protein
VRRHRIIAGLQAILLVGPLACAADDRDAVSMRPADDVITVGSFDFAESVVLAEVYSQALEAGGYDVQRAFGLGPREFVGPALANGLVELVPEYAGTAAEFVSLGTATPTNDPAQTHDELLAASGSGAVTALAAAPAQDANTFVVTRETARRLGIQTLSELADVAGTLTFGGPPECPSRPLCLAGLEERYGIRFADVMSLDAGGPVTLQAVRGGDVDVALMFTTDPAIDSEGLVELIDDRGLQPAENVTPLIRTDLIERWGAQLPALLDGVSATLTTAAVRDLNVAYAASGDAATVAADWLRSEEGST